MEQKVKPHWAWFFVVPVLIIGGLVGAIVVGVMGVFGFVEGMQRVNVPGSGTVRIDEPGEYVIFYEQMDVAQASVPEGLEVVVTPVGGGEALAKTTLSGSMTYNYGNRAARGYRGVTFTDAGEYRITATLPEGATAGGSLTLTGDGGGKLGVLVLGAFALGFGGFVLGIIILIVLLVMRAKSRKRINQQLWRQQPPPGMPPDAPAGY